MKYKNFFLIRNHKGSFSRFFFSKVRIKVFTMKPPFIKFSNWCILLWYSCLNWFSCFVSQLVFSLAVCFPSSLANTLVQGTHTDTRNTVYTNIFSPFLGNKEDNVFRVCFLLIKQRLRGDQRIKRPREEWRHKRWVSANHSPLHI